MTEKHIAVNVFDEEKTPEQETTQSSQQQQNQPPDNETKTTPTGGESSQTTSQAIDTNTSATQQDAFTSYTPWIIAGIVAIIILVALFAILRKLGKKPV